MIDGHADVPLQLLHNERLQHGVQALGADLPVKTRGTYTKGVSVDVPKLLHGRVAAQVWAAWVPPEATALDAVALGMQQVELALSAVDAHPQHLVLARTPEEVRASFKAGRVGVILGLEGGHSIGNNLHVLRGFHRLGVRLLTLTHTGHLPWVSSCADWAPQLGGLSPFGKVVIKELNRLGMLVDLSHASEAAMSDVLDATLAPVIWSHSNAFRLCPDPRNVPDDILHRVVTNRGLVMVTFPEQFVVCGTNHTDPLQVVGIEHVINHLNYLVDVMGVDHVGIGSDYDGCKWIPAGLEHVGKMPQLVEAIMRTGRYKNEDVAKIVGGNFLRVWGDVQKISQSWTEPVLQGPETNLYTSIQGEGETPSSCHFQWDKTDE
mmetsp:Transcript_10089/g.19079  ORF Transcript_10089/g.19079 Transcript_10089/m.19079 type:complete len:377 (+) Transcript_10089:469-1599(+)